MAILETLDAILTMLEPGGAIDPGTDLRTSTSGVVVDHSGEEPFRTDFAPNVLYGRPVADEHQRQGVGGATTTPEVERFTLELSYVVDSQAEYDAKRRKRSVSDALDGKAHDYAALIRRNRSRYDDGTPAPWHDLNLSGLDWSRLRSLNVRGVTLRLTGYRVVS
jgi:hypothetical protein